MPCGDSNAFPGDAFKKIGNALVNKQFTTDLLAPTFDVALFIAGQIGGGSTPVPFPKPTFGAGVESHVDADYEDAGRTLLSFADQHDAGGGAKLGPNVGAFPWKAVLSVLGTVINGIILALGENPIPKPDPVPPN